MFSFNEKVTSTLCVQVPPTLRTDYAVTYIMYASIYKEMPATTRPNHTKYFRSKNTL